jgi:hypothetical protein
LAAEDHLSRHLMRIALDVTITPRACGAHSTRFDDWRFGDLPAQYHLACLSLRVYCDCLCAA